MERTYAVYILASRSRVLYVGVTNDLIARVSQHRNGLVPGFTSRYRIHRLVHFETFADIRDAIARIKGWRREKKVALIQTQNPAWEDLAANFFPAFPHQEKQIPRSARDDRGARR